MFLKLFIYSIISILFFSNCGLVWTFKILDAYEEEHIVQPSFKEELSFEILKGFIVIEVEVEDVIRKFIFDTGASSVLDNDFSDSLKTTKIGKRKTVDSNNKKDFVPYVRLDHFEIGSLTFKDAVASVSNLAKLSDVTGVEISGIIGANAMNKSIWQIDFEKRILKIASHIDSMEVSPNCSKINFSSMEKGTPTFSMYSNGEFWGEAIFDTGSNGGIDMNIQYLSDTIPFVENESVIVGLYSEIKKVKKIATIPILSVTNDFTIENQTVTFFEDAPFAFIGTKFMKDYKITIDWKYQYIYFEKY